MATYLETPKGVKKFNSYYLAVVEKNKLLAKGIKTKLIDKNEMVDPKLPQTRDSKLRTVYNASDLKALAKLRRAYDPMMFGEDYRESRKKKAK